MANRSAYELFSQLKTDSVDRMFDEAHIKAIDISSMEFTGDKLESTFIQNAVIDSLKYLDGNTVQESRVIPT